MKCSKLKDQSSNEKIVDNCISNPDLCALPSVAEMTRAAGLAPKKSLGQNFLFGLNLVGKIARAVPDIKNSTVLEVGPGPGGLTRALLATGARRVIAIEKDRTAAPILEQIAAASDNRLEIIFGDALKIFKCGKWKVECGLDNCNNSTFHIPHSTFAICANLPYNIGTELLIRWLHIMAGGNPSPISSMTLMFQREVAQRIVAKPGSPQYGRLSVLTALVADARVLFNVPRTAFTPAPKVDSAVVQIIPKKFDANNDLHLQKIESVTARLFGQRRKMIRGIIPNVDWTAFGLSGMERAEELPPEKFAELAREIMVQ